ncbi:MAG: hypothetical protein QM777_02770 [Pseudorhodoferax sp.]
MADIPSPIDLPGGCRFQSRCPHATARCAAERPVLRPVGMAHWIACHYDIGADAPARPVPDPCAAAVPRSRGAAQATTAAAETALR